MAEEAAGSKNLLRSLVKELSRQLLTEDNTLPSQIARLLAQQSPGPLPEVISLDSVEVLLEPLLWLLFFTEEKITHLSFRDRLGVPGVYYLAFQNALRAHFGGRDGVVPWQENRIQALLKLIVQFANAFIRYPTPLKEALHDFLAENKSLIDDIRNVITHLEWDLLRKRAGKKHAAKFLLKAKLRAGGFSRHNKNLVAISSVRGDDAPAGNLSEDDEDDVIGEQSVESTTKKNKEKPAPGKAKSPFAASIQCS